MTPPPLPNACSDQLVVLQLQKWDLTQFQVKISDYSEAFISPSRKMLLLHSRWSEALLLPLNGADILSHFSYCFLGYCIGLTIFYQEILSAPILNIWTREGENHIFMCHSLLNLTMHFHVEANIQKSRHLGSFRMQNLWSGLIVEMSIIITRILCLRNFFW